jgi:1-acyl-sn-glycerol-3-phosphate acyltransferase
MQRSLTNRLWYKFIKTIVRIVGAVFYRIRAFGLQNIPAEGGVLAVCNHQSHLDPPLVGICSPRQMSFLARDTLFVGPFGKIIYSIGAIPIDREGAALSGIKESLKRLKQGDMLLLFPEGTRTNDGAIKAFRPGFTTLAVRSKSAILPVAIDGAFEAFPRSQKFPRPGRVRVYFGKPILPSEYANLDEKELIAEVERRVHECQAELKRTAIASQGGRTDGMP